MTAFVALLSAVPLIRALWKRYEFRERRSETSLTLLSIGHVQESFEPEVNDRNQISKVCSDRTTHRPPVQPARDEVQAQEVISPRLYYFAAWTDSGCLLGCPHHHATVISAVACISEAGGYVIAVEKGNLRALNDAEEEMFLLAAYGINTVARRLRVFEPMRALKPSLN